MTKQLRKGLMTVLLFVMAIVCAFSASNLFTARADDKADAFVANATAFVEVADADDDGVLANDEIRAVMGTEADTYFHSMYNFINNDATGDFSSVTGYATAKSNFDKILAQYNKNGAVDLYSKLVVRAYTIHATNQASYTNNAEVEAMRTAFTTIYNSADTKDLEFLKNSDLAWVSGKVEVAGVMETADIPKDLDLAEKKMVAFRVAIEDAIQAIQEIKIYDATVNTDEMIFVWDADATPAAYRTFAEDNVVISSQPSIVTAETAVNAVKQNGDIAFIDGTKTFDGVKLNSLEIVTKARTYLDKQIAKITAVENEINTLYTTEFSVVAGAEVVYTIGSKIDTADTNYNALPTDKFNNLKAEVEGAYVTMLDEMTKALSAIKNEIIEVEGKIAAIDTVVYTKQSKGLIDAARTAFDALDNDVKVNDNNKFAGDTALTYAVDADLADDDYATLKDAEAKWAKFETEIEELVKAIDALRDIEVNKPEEIFAAFNRVQNGDSNVDTFLVGYNQLSDKNNQLYGGATGDNLPGVNAATVTKFTPSEGGYGEISTAEAAYAYYRNLANAITEATKNIIKDITALDALYTSEVRFTSEFDTLYEAIVKAIAAPPVTTNGVIDPRYKGAINNFDKYEALKAKYEDLHKKAGEWFDAIDAIGTVCVETFDEIVIANEKYTALADAYAEDYSLSTDLTAYTKAYGSSTYAGYFATYKKALLAEIAINVDLYNLMNAANALVRPDLGGDYAKYAEAVAKVTAKYEALHCEKCKEYFRTTVRTITADDPATEADETVVWDLKAAYDAYVDALVYVQANAIETEIAKIETLKDENVNYIALARTAYDAAAGVTDVYTADEVKAAVRNYTVLTDAETAIQTWINNVNALLNGAGFAKSDNNEYVDILAKDVDATVVISKDNVTTGFYRLAVDKATGYEAKWSANELSNVAKAYVTTDYNAKTAYDLVCAMLRIAGTDATGLSTKLTYIDTMLKDFVDSYNANTTPQVNYDTLYGWVAALTDTQRALIKTNVGAFEQIASDKAMADELANAIETLYNSKEITSDSVVQYYIIKTIYEGLNGSQKALVVIDVENGNVEKAFETIATNLDPVDYDFATIIGRIAALEGKLAEDGAVEKALEAVLKDAKDYVDQEIAKLSQDGGAIKVNADAINTAVGRIESLETSVTNLDGTYATDDQLTDAIAALSGTDGAITKAKEAAIAKAQELVDELKNGDVKANADAIAALQTTVTNIKETMATDEELATAIEGVEKALEDAIADLEAADAQLKKDLENSVAELKKSITIVTVILGVISAALAGCVIFIFIKKK